MTGTNGDDGEVDDAERRKQRALKRFQVVSKEVDRGVAGAYLALAEGSEGSGLGEGEWRGARGEKEGGDEQEKQGGWRRGKTTEKEKDAAAPRSALDAYFSDEEWERAAPRPAKGKVKQWTVVGAVLPPSVGKA